MAGPKRRSGSRAMLERGLRRALIGAAVAILLSACAHQRDTPRQTPCEGKVLPTPFRIIAHRGASAYAPENTLPAFERALELGVHEVELDVGLSADGIPILFHDSALDAKTELSGALRQHSASELQRADIGSWFDRNHPDVARRYAGTTLSTLDALFRRFGAQLHYHVEIKGEEPELPERILELVALHDLRHAVTITSFSKEQLERTRALDRELPLCWLLEREARLREGSGSSDTSSLALRRPQLEAARAAGFAQVGVRAPELNREIVAHAHSLGLEIRGWGVRGDADMQHVIAVGANGTTTNWPDRLIACVERSEAR